MEHVDPREHALRQLLARVRDLLEVENLDQLREQNRQLIALEYEIERELQAIEDDREYRRMIEDDEEETADLSHEDIAQLGRAA